MLSIYSEGELLMKKSSVDNYEYRKDGNFTRV